MPRTWPESIGLGWEHGRVRSGIGLARDFWERAIRPILDTHCPGMPRAAARVGTGSDVLGLDDAMSSDHDWGLRLQVFVPRGEESAVRAVLNEYVPQQFAGLPSRFQQTGAAEAELGVNVLTVNDFATDRLGFDPRRPATPLDWLSLTGQAVLEVTAGAVFDDAGGELTALRAALEWYPDDVWRYVVACDWRRLDQELPLMARAADRGDVLGSRVIAARLVDIAMHLGFMLSRRWPPYAKWRGTMFGRLGLPAGVGLHLDGVLREGDWRVRNEHLAGALEELAVLQGRAGLPSASPACVPFWDRPYLHINPSLVPHITASLTDPAVASLPMGLGSIEQISDNVDLLMDARRRRDRF